MNITAFWDRDFREKHINKLKITLPTCIVLLLITMIPISNHNLEITAFDVGNADAFMIKTPDNKRILIDTAKNGYNGGKSQAELILLKYFKDQGTKNIDSIIVTHFDNDHCGGAADLIKNLKVNRIYLNNLNIDSKSAKLIYKTAKDNAVKILEAQSGQVVYSQDDLKIINFITDIKGVGDNESSIITLLSYKDFSMLFTGDAGIETLERLKDKFPQNITVLKVGHHGASGVINKNMADYLNPKISIISTGENKFGHPSIYTLETLRNSAVLRTDINNSIKLVVNKNGYKLQAYNTKKKKYINF